MINFRIKFFHTNHAKLENQIIIQNKINFRIKSCFIQKSINLRLKFILFDKSILKKLPWYLLAIILQAANQQVCMGVECGRFTADIYICILILIYLLIYICILILIYYLLIWLFTMHWHFCSRVTALDRDFNQVHELWLLRSPAKNTNFVQVIIKSVLKTCLSYNHGS